MPDVRSFEEVFEMVTKHAEPEIDAWREQERRHRQAARKRRLGALAVAAAFAVAAIVVLVVSRPGDGPPPAVDGGSPSGAPAGTLAPPFVLDLDTGTRSPLPESLAPGRPSDLPASLSVQLFYAGSPDGSAIAWQSCQANGCHRSDTAGVAFADGTGGREIAPEEGLNAYGLQWSPDGAQLVYLMRDGSTSEVGNLVVQDVATGETRRITDLELERVDWWFLAPSFGRDGDDVLFHLPRSGNVETVWDVWTVPVTGGEPTLLIRDAQFPLATSAGIAVVDPAEDALGGPSLSLLAGDGSGPRRTLVEAADSIWWPSVSPDGNRIAFADQGFIRIVDVRTGEVADVAEGSNAGWLGDDALIVTP